MKVWSAPRLVTRLAVGIAMMECAVFAIGGMAEPLQSTAAEAIRSAIVARLGVAGETAEVTVLRLDIPDPGAVREARPDPSAWLGRPIKFTLIRAQGTPVIAVATVRVIAERAVARRAIARNAVVGPEDVNRVREEVREVPLRSLPLTSALIGGRALRPVAADTTILPGTVVVRRVIEPGDRVTVVASQGEVEVTAEMVASDGGAVGDVIRVMNPETRRYLRGRVVRAGVVELKAARGAA